jgi:hypothetical protein
MRRTKIGLIWNQVKTTKSSKSAEPATARNYQRTGNRWVNLLKKADSAKTSEEKKRWRRQALRAFYGDNRGDKYA